MSYLIKYCEIYLTRIEIYLDHLKQSKAMTIEYLYDIDTIMT